MSRADRPSPMLAQPAGLGTTTPKTPSRSSLKKGLLPAKARPEDVFGLLRQLIETDQVEKARRLATEAAQRFPGSEEIHLAESILSEARTTPNPYVQPTATAEIEWLRSPPAGARGKWVALIGNEVVGMADSLEELKRSLETKKLDQYPVVQHIAA